MWFAVRLKKYGPSAGRLKRHIDVKSRIQTAFTLHQTLVRGSAFPAGSYEIDFFIMFILVRRPTPTKRRSMNRADYLIPPLIALTLLLPACAAKIYGNVQLMDANLQPLPKENLQGTVVNMINTTATLEQASHSVNTDAEGKYESVKDQLKPGTYKVEANRIGYATETQTVEIKGSTRKKIEFQLKKIQEGSRKTIKGTKSDEDKIINPGEVNIQPPSM
jgi:hypothetical protein